MGQGNLKNTLLVVVELVDEALHVLQHVGLLLAHAVRRQAACQGVCAIVRPELPELRVLGCKWLRQKAHHQLVRALAVQVCVALATA